MSNKILFISVDGMTDQLGQSQVLPYLIELAGKGFNVSIVSCEKQANFLKNEKVVASLVKQANIEWIYCFYENKIPIYSQQKNVRNLYRLAEQFVKANENIILHCRSYLPALVGLRLKQKYQTKLIFDMRGFWADERIDGGIWKLSNPIQKYLYKYFKRKEIELIKAADYIVTLTNNAKNEIQSWEINDTPSIEVIPCCADVNHFKIFTAEEKNSFREDLKIPQNAYVLGYLGSLGTWYMLDEMLDFFLELQSKKPNSIFFFVTNDNEKDILLAAEKRNINTKSIIVKSANRNEVPQFISCFDASLFFIKPLYSKKGSSPTKMAEILACGVPVITNTGVGDMDEIISTTKCGVLIAAFDKNIYQQAIDEMDKLDCTSKQYRDIAIQNFSLEKGVTSYNKVYSYLSK